MGKNLYPRECVRNVYELTPKWFKNRGITAIICDLDDTLMPYHTTKSTPALAEWIQSLKDADISICILSNGKAARILPMCSEFRVKCVPLAFKPFPFGFNRALRKLGITDKKGVAVIGDQIFTDVVGGNLVGLHTVLVEPVAIKSSAIEKLKRRFEVKFRKAL